MTNISDEEKIMLERLENRILTKSVSNDFLVQNIILSMSYLNLRTIQQYCKENNMTYRGVKNHRIIVKLLNKNFVIDNE